LSLAWMAISLSLSQAAKRRSRVASSRLRLVAASSTMEAGLTGAGGFFATVGSGLGDAFFSAGFFTSLDPNNASNGFQSHVGARAEGLAPEPSLSSSAAAATAAPSPTTKLAAKPHAPSVRIVTSPTAMISRPGPAQQQEPGGRPSLC